MKYATPSYKQEGIETELRRPLFGTGAIEVPKLDYPINPVENFKLSYSRQKPLWVPNVLTEMDNIMLGLRTILPDTGREKRYDIVDEYGVKWIWVPEAGGPMLKPNTIFLDDITKWREKVVFPDYRASDWGECAKEFMANDFSPNRVVHLNIGQGATERLVSLLGGYTEFLVALMVEPEACKDFFDTFADYTIGLIDYAFEIFPVLNMVTYHDDWGTEKDTFFSEKIMEELLFDATKRVVQRVRDYGACFQLHSCGRIERFVPYMIELGVDLIQIQSRANDLAMIKEKYGDKIGFNCQIESSGAESSEPTTEEFLRDIRFTVDKYASLGGIYFGTNARTPEMTWAATYELFNYSREFYEKEQGRA